MQKIKRGLAFLLLAVMLGTILPVASLADVTEAADEVVFNTGYMEITVGREEDDGRDFYTTFNPDGGYTIELAEENPFFPYEVQFRCGGETSSEWFESEDSTVTVGGHRFSVAVLNGEAQHLSFRAGGQSFAVYPEEKEFVHDPDRGIAAISLLPLKEKHLSVDLHNSLGSELKNIKVDGGPESGVWGTAESDVYYRFGEDAGIDLSTYFGITDQLTLEIIDGDDPLNPDLKRYIVDVELCDISNLLKFYGYLGTAPAEVEVSADSNHYDLSLEYGSWPKWTVGSETYRIGLGDGFSGYDVEVYYGNYATEADAVAAGSDVRITDKVWHKNGTAPKPGSGMEYFHDEGNPEGGKFTFVFKKDGREVFVYNTSITGNIYLPERIYYDMARNFDAQVCIDGTEWAGREYDKYTYWNSNFINGFLVSIFRENAEQYQDNPMRLNFSKMAGGSKPKVTVYQGAYHDIEELQAAIASGETTDVTSQIWGPDAPGIRGNYCYTNRGQAPRFTLLIQKGDVPDSDWGGGEDGGDIVQPISAQIINPEFFIASWGTSLCYEDDGRRRDFQLDYYGGQYENDKYHPYRIYTLLPGFSANGTYYFSLLACANGNYYWNYEDGLEPYIEKAVVGKCATADEVRDNSKPDIKTQLFTDAMNPGGGYGADYSKRVTFTVLDAYGELHYVDVQAIASPSEVASRPRPQSVDTYFRVRGANQSASGSPYAAYLMKYSDDGYYYNGYQTVFLLNGDGSAVTDATIYPTFWTGSKVSVYAALDTASGDKVESGKSPAAVTFGQPIQYSAGSESGTHLKNYWVTFVTRTADGPDLFVNGATNSRHKDEESGLPVREVFLNAGYGYHHDIFFANIGNAQMEGLSVTLSDDAQNIALDDYWKIGTTKTLAAFDSVDTTTEYGELPNVSKIRLVPKKNADGTLAAGEISGTLTISYQKGGETEKVEIKLTGTAAKPKITTDSIKPGVKYVHYSSVIQTDNMYNADGVTFRISEGTLPNGITLKPNGELYGVPTVTGSYTVTVQALYDGAESDRKEFTLTIADNTNENVWNATDNTYDVTTAIPNEDGTLTISTMNKGDNTFDNPTQLFVSKGEYTRFIELKLDGRLLVEGTDYTKEPGSTRITIQTQTLKNVGNTTTHTLSAEFREGDTMKRAAQNYEIKPSQTSGDGGSGSGQGSNSGTTSGTGNSGGQNPPTPSKPVMSFADVPEQAWFYHDVKWAYENEYMVGVSNTEFDPNTAIGQGTVVTVLARMADAKLDQLSTEGYDNITPNQWYSKAAVWATQAGLLPDNSVFEENGPISRGKMAIMLAKYLKSMGIDTNLPEPLANFADADLMTQEEVNAFQVLYKYGIFLGVGEMRMNPLGVTSRCEFSALIHRLNTVLAK